MIIDKTLDLRLNRALVMKTNLNENLFKAHSLNEKEWLDLFLGNEVYE